MHASLFVGGMEYGLVIGWEVNIMNNLAHFGLPESSDIDSLYVTSANVGE